jgi:transcriptional repressor NrdR
MHCPYCRHTDTRVLDSRVADDGGAIRRRRTCPACQRRFSTVEQMQLTVMKRSGATEPFNRDKAIAGVRKACKGRPVTEHDLALLGQSVEDTLRGGGWAEVPAHEVGLAILGPLRELDEVAYLRFASVYRSFESAEDFETEIAMLRAEAPPAPVIAVEQAADQAVHEHIRGTSYGAQDETTAYQET